MPAGRPSGYSPEVAAIICERLATGESVRKICDDDDELPEWRTVFAWLARYPEFQQQYARAKQLGIEALADDIVAISDDGRNDWMEKLAYNGGVPGWETNGEAINRSRLRVDTRKWILSKLAPKKYGDKIEIDASVTAQTGEAAKLAEVMTPEELEHLRQRLAAAKQISS